VIEAASILALRLLRALRWLKTKLQILLHQSIAASRNCVNPRITTQASTWIGLDNCPS